MPWDPRKRRDELPDDWRSLRRAILRRDRYTCQLRRPGCLTTATEVDHVRPGSDDSPQNLRAACAHCHVRKSAAEGHARRAQLRARRRRPQERHPGSRD